MISYDSVLLLKNNFRQFQSIIMTLFDIVSRVELHVW